MLDKMNCDGLFFCLLKRKMSKMSKIVRLQRFFHDPDQLFFKLSEENKKSAVFQGRPRHTGHTLGSAHEFIYNENLTIMSRFLHTTITD